MIRKEAQGIEGAGPTLLMKQSTGANLHLCSHLFVQIQRSWSSNRLRNLLSPNHTRCHTLHVTHLGVLSVAYFITVLTVLYFYLRAIMYNFVAVEVARLLGFLELAEKVYAETPEAKGLFQRKMAGSSIPYGPYTRAYFILGPLVLVVLWVVVAVL